MTYCVGPPTGRGRGGPLTNAPRLPRGEGLLSPPGVAEGGSCRQTHPGEKDPGVAARDEEEETEVPGGSND
ncbi:hypothetical protein VULLAG_LOCUS18351 [Vulpes lagopus]